MTNLGFIESLRSPLSIAKRIFHPAEARNPVYEYSCALQSKPLPFATPAILSLSWGKGAERKRSGKGALRGVRETTLSPMPVHH